MSPTWPPWNLVERPLTLDGAMGSALIAAGLELPTPPEAWILDHPEIVRSVHQAHRCAGADVITTCTFGATRANLDRHGLGAHFSEINRTASALAREVAGPEGWVAGNVGPLVRDDRAPADVGGWARASFEEQAEALASAGVDLFLVETLSDPVEARAALDACLPTGRPVVVTLACRPPIDGPVTLTGAPARETLDSLVDAGAAAVGFNCMRTPAEMLPLAREARPSDPTVPLVVQPNAGQPRRDASGAWTYDLGPAEFAEGCVALRGAGVSILGGCCGTTAEHLAALVQALGEGSRPWHRPAGAR